MSDSICCKALEQALDDDGRRSPALIERETFDLKTGTSGKRMFVLHSGEHRKRGLVLNYCPWCGASVLPKEWRSPEVKAKGVLASA